MDGQLNKQKYIGGGIKAFSSDIRGLRPLALLAKMCTPRIFSEAVEH